MSVTTTNSKPAAIVRHEKRDFGTFCASDFLARSICRRRVLGRTIGADFNVDAIEIIRRLIFGRCSENSTEGGSKLAVCRFLQFGGLPLWRRLRKSPEFAPHPLHHLVVISGGVELVLGFVDGNCGAGGNR